MALLQRLGGGDVGQHHELLDQLVAVEPLAHADLGDAAVVAQGDLALGQVEVERTALLACRQQNLEGAVERADDGAHQGRDLGVGRAVLGALDAGVGEARGRADHGAVEAVALEMPFGIDPHFCHQHRPVLLRDQRAPVVGERLGQHGHDPVGEIDRGAAAVGGAVERLVVPHVPGDVGDGDQDAPAAGMVRVGLGEHRVVEVAGVLAVDRDQRRVAQVEALAQGGGAGALGLLQRRRRELDRDVVGRDRDQADGARVAHRPDALDHAGATGERAARRLDPDDVARLGAVLVGRPDVEAQLQLAVGRGHEADAVAAVGLLVEAQHLARGAAQQADDAGLVGGLAAALQRSEHAVADGGGHAAAVRLRDDFDAGRGAVLFFVVAARHGQQMAVVVDPHDLQYGDISQCFWILECLGAVGGDVA